MAGIILIHGFAGAIFEIEALRDYLINELGYEVVTPVLAGHGKTRRELAKSTRHEWYQSVKDAYLELKSRHDDIIAIGFSMGGLMATKLHNEFGLKKLVTLNTPVYYWSFKNIFKNIFSDFKTYLPKYIKSTFDKPIHALLEFQLILSETKPLFDNIDCDLLVVQVQNDDTVQPRSGEYIYNHAKSVKKKIVKPDLGGHVLFKSEYYNEVLPIITEFIEN